MADNKIVQTAINFFLIAQLVFVVISAGAFFALTYRIKHFDYTDIKVDQERIYKTISKATVEFLRDYQTNQFEKVTQNSTNENVKIDYVVGIIYGSRRGDTLRYRGVDFHVGDFFDIDGKACSIQAIDFDRQRFYCFERSGFVHICVIIEPEPKESIFGERASSPPRPVAGGGLRTRENDL